MGATLKPPQVAMRTARTANASDLPVLIPLNNQAFAIRTFLDGTRTAEECLSAIMRKGDTPVAERDGQTVACA
ncbi:MAG: hypothetical protein WB762_07135 [Candidatus Sulfotelmatobacter sp.]